MEVVPMYSFQSDDTWRIQFCYTPIQNANNMLVPESMQLVVVDSEDNEDTASVHAKHHYPLGHSIPILASIAPHVPLSHPKSFQPQPLPQRSKSIATPVKKHLKTHLLIWYALMFYSCDLALLTTASAFCRDLSTQPRVVKYWGPDQKSITLAFLRFFRKAGHQQWLTWSIRLYNKFDEYLLICSEYSLTSRYDKGLTRPSGIFANPRIIYGDFLGAHYSQQASDGGRRLRLSAISNSSWPSSLHHLGYARSYTLRNIAYISFPGLLWHWPSGNVQLSRSVRTSDSLVLTRSGA